MSIDILIFQVETDSYVYGSAKNVTIQDGCNDSWTRSSQQKVVINEKINLYGKPGDVIVMDENKNIVIYRHGKGIIFSFFLDVSLPSFCC